MSTGIEPSDIELSVKDNVLTPSGEPKAPEIPEGENWNRSKRGVEPTWPENMKLAYTENGEGDFERAFTLCGDFNPDGIETGMRCGGLTSTLPWAFAAQPGRIAIKAA